MNKLQTIVWLLPAGTVKNRLLRLFGHEISSSARVGAILAVNVGHAVLGEDASISGLNIVRSIRQFRMGAGATIGSFNTITCAPEFRMLSDEVGSLIMGAGAAITSRHYIDCSGIVEMGDMSAISGQRTTILSHEIDLALNVQSAGQVVIGERSVVSTNCLLLKGAILPHHSLLIAESKLGRSRKLEPPTGIYGGSPAEYIRPNPLEDGESWFERAEARTTTLRIDLPRKRGSDRARVHQQQERS